MIMDITDCLVIDTKDSPKKEVDELKKYLEDNFWDWIEGRQTSDGSVITGEQLEGYKELEKRLVKGGVD